MTDDTLRSVELTRIGAVGFFVGAVLLVPEMRDAPPRS